MGSTAKDIQKHCKQHNNASVKRLSNRYHPYANSGNIVQEETVQDTDDVIMSNGTSNENAMDIHGGLYDLILLHIFSSFNRRQSTINGH